MPRLIPHNRITIKERRENILTLLTKGMKGYEIAKELGVDASTVSRDIQYLVAQSQNPIPTTQESFSRRGRRQLQAQEWALIV
jgi:IS30 family transposase